MPASPVTAQHRELAPLGVVDALDLHQLLDQLLERPGIEVELALERPQRHASP
jgi:hypothetical protein